MFLKMTIFHRHLFRQLIEVQFHLENNYPSRNMSHKSLYCHSLLTKSIDALGLFGANGLGMFDILVVVKYITIVRIILLIISKKKKTTT